MTMWWIDKFGTARGPYSDEQIQRLVAYGQLGSLHRISTDRRSWQYVKETAFWKHKESRGENASFAKGDVVKARDDSEQLSSQYYPREIKQSEITPTNKMGMKPLALIITGISFLIAMVLVSAVRIFAFGRKENGSSVSVSPTLVAESRDDSPSKNIGLGGSANVAGIDFNSVKKRVALIRCKEGVGTGFLVKMNDKIYLLTNEHVIRSVSAAEATLVDGTRIRLGAFSIAKDRDLARFEVDNAKDWYEIAKDAPNNEDNVWVFGNSSGDGVITTLKGRVTGVGDVCLKTDAQFVQGNSGSPIVGKDGQVLAVAAFMKNGSNGQDWTVRDTEFDKVRRFGIRLNNIQWTSMERKEFEAECAAFESFEAYWDLLVPYLICLDVSDEDYAELKLEQREMDKGKLGDDRFGFHEMLCDLSRALSQQGDSWAKWKSHCNAREELISELDKAVDTGNLSSAKAEDILRGFDLEKDTEGMWSRVKDKHRNFYAKRREALLLARQALQSGDWHNSLMKNGYSADDKVGCIVWYLNVIKSFIDKNSQNLKDLNKKLKKLEGEEDEE